MNLITIISVLAISLLFTILFVVILKSKGPWGSGWTFFTIVSLWLAAVSLWIPPAGPVWFGVAVIDLVLTALLISFVLSATSIDPTHSNSWQADQVNELSTESDTGQETGTPASKKTFVRDLGTEPSLNSMLTFRTGGLFWMLLLCLGTLIIIGAV